MVQKVKDADVVGIVIGTLGVGKYFVYVYMNSLVFQIFFKRVYPT